MLHMCQAWVRSWKSSSVVPLKLYILNLVDTMTVLLNILLVTFDNECYSRECGGRL